MTEITQADRQAAKTWALTEGYLFAVHNLTRAFAQHRARARASALEEAKTAVRDCMVDQEWPPTGGDRQIDEVLAAIDGITEGEAR